MICHMDVTNFRLYIYTERLYNPWYNWVFKHVTKFCHIWSLFLFNSFYSFLFWLRFIENVTKYVTNRLNPWDCRGFTILILSHFCPMWQNDVTNDKFAYNKSVKTYIKMSFVTFGRFDVTKIWHNIYVKMTNLCIKSV